jgi:hypothetical protein
MEEAVGLGLEVAEASLGKAKHQLGIGPLGEAEALAEEWHGHGLEDVAHLSVFIGGRHIGYKDLHSVNLQEVGEMGEPRIAMLVVLAGVVKDWTYYFL